MKILILENSQYLTESKDVPITGRRYVLEDAETYTGQQRKTWHAFVGEWFRAGQYPVDTIDYNYFRDWCKLKYGEGFGHYEYTDWEYNMVRVKSVDEIPSDIVEWYNDHPGSKRIKGILKSFTGYTKKQVINSTDKIINAMVEYGADTEKYYQILEGMEK